MEKYQHDAPISFISLEGYMAGKLFAQIATMVPGELTRENSSRRWNRWAPSIWEG